jgi:phosphoribosylpyrophosphate synthetase
VSHGVLSGFAVSDLENSVLTRIVLTDSILRHSVLPEKFEDLSLASLIVDAIRCIL